MGGVRSTQYLSSTTQMNTSKYSLVDETEKNLHHNDKSAHITVFLAPTSTPYGLSRHEYRKKGVVCQGYLILAVIKNTITRAKLPIFILNVHYIYFEVVSDVLFQEMQNLLTLQHSLWVLPCLLLLREFLAQLMNTSTGNPLYKAVSDWSHVLS